MRIVIAALLAVWFGGPVAAADLKDKSDGFMGGLPTISDSSLSGIWFGVLGGADFTNAKIGVCGEGDCGSVRGLGADGWKGEVQVGIDKQIGGMFVAGVFGAAQMSNSSFEVNFSGSSVFEVTKDWGWLGGVRVGMRCGKTALCYVGGGYGQTDFSGAGQTETFEHFFGEVGIEAQLSGSVYGKVAGRYMAYQERDIGGISVDPTGLEAMAGLVIKIGGGY